MHRPFYPYSPLMRTISPPASSPPHRSVLPKLRRQGSRWGGFTLTELLVGLLITGLTSTAVISLMTTFLRAERDFAARSNAFQDMNRVLDLVSDEVRSALVLSRDPTCPAVAPGCTPVLELPIDAENAIFYYLMTEANRTRIERVGPAFLTNSRDPITNRYTGDEYNLREAGDPVNTPTQVWGQIPESDPTLCPTGTVGGSTEAFSVCIDGQLATIRLQSEDGTVVTTQTASRVLLDPNDSIPADEEDEEAIP